MGRQIIPKCITFFPFHSDLFFFDIFCCCRCSVCRKCHRNFKVWFNRVILCLSIESYHTDEVANQKQTKCENSSEFVVKDSMRRPHCCRSTWFSRIFFASHNLFMFFFVVRSLCGTSFPWLRIFMFNISGCWRVFVVICQCKKPDCLSFMRCVGVRSTTIHHSIQHTQCAHKVCEMWSDRMVSLIC